MVMGGKLGGTEREKTNWRSHDNLHAVTRTYGLINCDSSIIDFHKLSCLPAFFQIQWPIPVIKRTALLAVMGRECWQAVVARSQWRRHPRQNQVAVAAR